MKKISVIGAAIADIIAGPVDKAVFETGSMPMNTIKMTYGGDALNESVIMSRLGLEVEIITKVGDDETGRNVISFLESNGVSCKAVVDESIETGINIVLVDKDGQRSFLTNPLSSLRKLALEDVIGRIDDMGDIVCFASMFVSPLLDIPAMLQIFEKVKSKPGRVLVVDMTTAKQGETIEDIRCLLPYIDYLIPNELEAKKLTGVDDPMANAKALVDAGVGCAIVKCGKDGCIINSDSECIRIPAYMDCVPVDTTGAGDSFVAGFVWGLSQGLSIADCGRYACAVSSCVVEAFGAHDGIKSIDEPARRYELI